jgi:hypothetical protein
MKPLKITAVSTFIFLLSCSSTQPKETIEKVIMDKHFIPFTMPMPSSRVGTMIRGNKDEIFLVARPEKCFPDIEDPNLSLRWTQGTDLPSQFQRTEVNWGMQINDILNTGNATINLKANGYNIKTVQIEFQGASIEFLEEANFFSFYEDKMSDECRKLVKKYTFISQALRIEAMSFIFKDDRGGNIDISTGALEQIVNITAGVRWRLTNNYTLKIDTPKYIGYRVGKLFSEGNDLGIIHASRVDDKGEWIFGEIKPLVNKLSTPFIRAENLD